MASLLTDPLFEKSGRGPPPNKNFYHFAITKTVDRYSKPGELKESHQDFLDDTLLQNCGFSPGEYTKALCQDHYDYLERLSDSILLRIINDLELEDVGQLGRTSHRFRELCGSEEFWEQAVLRRCNTVSPEVASLALEVGWRSIFFTSKLQLQKLISRRRLKAEEPPEGQLSDPHIKAEESLEGNPPGIIPKLSLGTDPGAGFDHSSYCDVDPESDLEAGSDSSVPALCQLFEETGKPCVETTEQNSAPNNSRGDFSAEPDKP
ncbi:hypothetical protein F7725_011959 [Dissostichus mawsoni]|uniref:F-box domain-containing protein n=1 Tax=Dissostichus mawsoni TaxID=36200 RepID=A0A7J5ZEG8_DISMA|nr:hypothetical protein F7725_011959 [Dissostichus mawsoni]